MRKKLFVAIAVLGFLSMILLHVSPAQENPGDAAEVIGNTFNVPKDKIPTTPEDIEKIRQDFLKKKWTEVIEKNKYLGPIHGFFIKIAPVFLVLFAHPYEFSLIFLLIVIIWIWLASQSTKIVKSFGFVKEGFAFLIGIGVAIIFAQTRIIKVVATFLLDLVFKQENWWMRTIIVVLILGIFAVAHVMSKLVLKLIIKRKEELLKQRTGEEFAKLVKLSNAIKKK